MLPGGKVGHSLFSEAAAGLLAERVLHPNTNKPILLLWMKKDGSIFFFSAVRTEELNDLHGHDKHLQPVAVKVEHSR